MQKFSSVIFDVLHESLIKSKGSELADIILNWKSIVGEGYFSSTYPHKIISYSAENYSQSIATTKYHQSAKTYVHQSAVTHHHSENHSQQPGANYYKSAATNPQSIGICQYQSVPGMQPQSVDNYSQKNTDNSWKNDYVNTRVDSSMDSSGLTNKEKITQVSSYNALDKTYSPSDQRNLVQNRKGKCLVVFAENQVICTKFMYSSIIFVEKVNFCLGYTAIKKIKTRVENHFFQDPNQES